MFFICLFLTSSSKSKPMAHFIQPSMWNFTWLIQTKLWPVWVQLFETIYGREWAVFWCNNPSLAIFIITSHTAANVYLTDATYRYSLPHIPKWTNLRLQMVYVGDSHTWLDWTSYIYEQWVTQFIYNTVKSSNNETERSKQLEDLTEFSKQL